MPRASSEQKLCFGRRLSSIPITWPDHLSWAFAIRTSTPVMLERRSTSWLVTHTRTHARMHAHARTHARASLGPFQYDYMQSHLRTVFTASPYVITHSQTITEIQKPSSLCQLQVTILAVQNVKSWTTLNRLQLMTERRKQSLLCLKDHLPQNIFVIQGVDETLTLTFLTLSKLLASHPKQLMYTSTGKAVQQNFPLWDD